MDVVIAGRVGEPFLVRAGDRLGAVARRGIRPAEVEALGQHDDAAPLGGGGGDHRHGAVEVLVRPAALDEDLPQPDPERRSWLRLFRSTAARRRRDRDPITATAAPLDERVERHRADEDQALDDRLPERLHAEQVEAVVDGADDQRADESAEDASLSARSGWCRRGSPRRSRRTRGPSPAVGCPELRIDESTIPPIPAAAPEIT